MRLATFQDRYDRMGFQQLFPLKAPLMRGFFMHRFERTPCLDTYGEAPVSWGLPARKDRLGDR